MNQPSTDQSANAPSVFISYAHEGDLPQQTKVLADYLKSQGFEVITDHECLDLTPDSGWRTWMQNGVRESDVVLLVGSEKYKARFEKKDKDPDAGQGVTWEATFIAHEIHQNKLTNNRLIPILPDGLSINLVPEVLKDWFNGCYFPSENQKIVRAIKESLRRQEKTEKLTYLESFSEPEAITADNGEQAKAKTKETIFDTSKQRSATYGINNRQLTGPADPLLQPEREVFLGRQQEVAEVLEFLRSASSSAHVLSRHLVGTAGIGKTEVCKAALKTWFKQDNPNMAVWWVQVPDESTPEDFLKQLAKMLEMPDDAVNRIRTAEELAMQPGLYYLDNLESIADSDKGREILKTLTLFQGVRILASSRVSLDGILGSEIKIDPLDKQSAIELFCKLYNGVDNPDEEAVPSFVDNELGRHALSIRLVAVLGKYYPSFDTLKAAWQEQGTAIAKSRNATSKDDSLEISFSLTISLLAKVQGALDLWQFLALFNRSIPDETLRLWEQESEHTQAFRALFDHNICSRTEDGIFMLPPVARFALSKDNLHVAEEKIGFNWQRAANHAMDYFLALSKFGDVLTGDPAAVAAKVLCARQLSTAHQLIQIATKTKTLSKDAILLFHKQCINIYQYNPVESLALLNTFSEIKNTSSIFRKMAQMERILGELEKSIKHFEKAISLAKSNHDEINLAHAHQDLADLVLYLNYYDGCRGHLKQAKAIYEKLNNALGKANCLQTLGNVEFVLGNIDDSRTHYKKAQGLFTAINDDMGLATVLRLLGQLEIHQDNWQVSYDYLQQSLQLHKSINFDLGCANSIRCIGYWHFKQGNYPDALNNYQTAIPLYQKVQDSMGLTYCFSNSLRCQKALGLLKETQLKNLAAKALKAAKAPDPNEYAKDTIADCFGFDLDTEKDKEAFGALLQELKSLQVDIYSPL